MLDMLILSKDYSLTGLDSSRGKQIRGKKLPRHRFKVGPTSYSNGGRTETQVSERENGIGRMASPLLSTDPSFTETRMEVGEPLQLARHSNTRSSLGSPNYRDPSRLNSRSFQITP